MPKNDQFNFFFFRDKKRGFYGSIEKDTPNITNVEV